MSVRQRGASRQDSRWQWRGYRAGAGRCRWRQPDWWPGLQEKVRWWLRGQPGFQDQGEGCISLSLLHHPAMQLLCRAPGAGATCFISSPEVRTSAPSPLSRAWAGVTSRGWHLQWSQGGGTHREPGDGCKGRRGRRHAPSWAHAWPQAGPRAAPDLALGMSPVSTKGWRVSCRQWQMGESDPWF